MPDQARAGMACQRDPALGEMHAMVRSEALLEERLRRLSHQLSDANLAQMPEFEQRVDVLRRLRYISGDNTVELKVETCIARLPLSLIAPSCSALCASLAPSASVQIIWPPDGAVQAFMCAKTMILEGLAAERGPMQSGFWG
jgi:hypothetical protein